MAERTEGFYVSISVTEIPDGGDLTLEVANESLAVLHTIPLSVSGGKVIVDIAQSTIDSWPTRARFRLTAVTTAGRTSTKWMLNTAGTIKFIKRSDVAVLDPRILSDTSFSEVGENSFVASISFDQGVKLTNWVDTETPPDIEYSKQDDFETSAHVSPITGLTAGTLYYIQQTAEFRDGTFASGSIKSVTTGSVGVSYPYWIGSSGNIDPDHLLQWGDDSPPPDREYAVFLDGSQVSGTLGNSVREYQFSNLSDGEHIFELEYFPAGNQAGAETIQISRTVGEIPNPTSNVLRPPQYNSVQSSWFSNAFDSAPAQGEQRTEPSSDLPSGTTFRRVSGDNAYHPYSKRKAINANSTMVTAGYQIWNISDGSNTGLSIGIGPRNEYNWSHNDPNVMMGIGLDKKSFVKRNVVTGVNTVVKTWSEYNWMSVGDFEGMQSADDRYVVLIGHFDASDNGPREHISFDIETGTVLGKITAEFYDNWSGFSQNGEFILVEGNNYGVADPTFNMRFYDKNFNHLRTIWRKPEHGDWGVDYLGNQVYVMLTGWGLNYVIASTGAVETIATSGFDWGHLSCRCTSRPGYCYATNNNSGGAVVEAQIKPSSQGPKFALYALPRSSGGDTGYNYGPMGVPNSDASMIAMHSDWQRGTPDSNIFEMVLKLPPA